MESPKTIAYEIGGVQNNTLRFALDGGVKSDIVGSHPLESTHQSMKNKKERRSVDSNPVLNLKSMIHEHSLFFDKLIELIPAKFYLPIEDKGKPWVHGLSKAEKALAKKESLENIKKARRARLDPEKSSTTTLDLLKQSLEKENSSNKGGGDETGIKPFMTGLEGGHGSVTYEELQQRLHRKIEELRGSRNSEDSNKAKKRIEKKETWEKKRKRDTESNKAMTTIGNSRNKVEKDAAEVSRELTFSRVKLDDEEHGKKRKLSKMKELEQAKRLEEAKKDPGKGEIISKKHSWKAATTKAAGIKVHDNPKLLKQSLKKEKKQHEKNVEKWKERIETTEKKKSEKQQKRSENIAHRIQDKKSRRIAKREKKLMHPGNAGRKEGTANKA